jgi:membrane-associated HD superfamily phosphohydrolase
MATRYRPSPVSTGLGKMEFTFTMQPVSHVPIHQSGITWTLIHHANRVAIWRFTFFWELILLGSAFMLSGLTALVVFSKRSRRHLIYAIWLLVAYIAMGVLLSLISATIVGPLGKPLSSWKS